MDVYILIFWGQSHTCPITGSIMDKPKRGRPRKNPPKVKKKTAKLAETLGPAERIKISISPSLKAKLSRLASYNRITESEQVRRLIDQADDVTPIPLATDPSTVK